MILSTPQILMKKRDIFFGTDLLYYLALQALGSIKVE